MTAVDWFCRGSISAVAPADRTRLLERTVSTSDDISRTAATIVERVRAFGDSAIREIAARYDGVSLDVLEVPTARIAAARRRVPVAVLAALEHAAANIEEVHRAFLPAPVELVTRDGVLVGRRADPLGRVGIYAPGGRAAYPSSVLMGAVPARVAGVGEIVVCSPPSSDGAPSDVVLAAAAIGGAHRVFGIGGAAAVAAMAYGTEAVPRVDRIVGPGNAWVAAAKLLVVGAVGIDAPAGPSELLVLADASANAGIVAREVVAQAEHDPMAAVVVVGTDRAWLDHLSDAVASELQGAGRATIVRDALRGNGALLLARDVAEGVAFAEEYAPEHLLLALKDADAWLPRVRNAGTVFVGERSSVAFGDYLTGANHVLPTGGLARAYSGLSTVDFMRWTTYQRVQGDAASRLVGDTRILAEAEGLPAHARAAEQWSAQ